ncbi:hypothetical protein [Nocardia sp. CA-290969]|uniref:hypothetical protein n=1 Tax=Nocardia sp. CA-290969 TaxID=3239986 RepID=UPI003D8D92FC
MSDQTPDTAAAEQDAPVDSAPEVPETDQETEEEQKNPAARQAAKYRRQLRDTEAERDGLRERVTGYERAEVERLVADSLADPADLWVAGTELDALRAEDGSIDPEKVNKTVAELLEQRPHWKRTTRTRYDVGSLRSGATSSGDTLPTSWQSAFGTALKK